MRARTTRTGRRNPLRRCAATMVLGFLIAADNAYAGDYSHACATPDGQYTFEDGRLVDSASRESGTNREIPYRVLQKTPLSETRGICESLTGTSKGGRFQWANQTYLLLFQIEGETFPRTAYCELAASGLPAAANCDRETISKSWAAVAANAAQGVSGDADEAAKRPSSLWTFDGSTVRLYADGSHRRIVADKPIPDLANAGVTVDTLVFHGTRSGLDMTGTLYLPSADCGTQTVPVTGKVSANQLSFTLTGRYQQRDPETCAVVTKRRGSWSFKFLRK
ncbi:MAG: hypothetical protein AAGC70_15835 [Pseudomonadota bacterium]